MFATGRPYCPPQPVSFVDTTGCGEQGTRTLPTSNISVLHGKWRNQIGILPHIRVRQCVVAVEKFPTYGQSTALYAAQASKGIL